MDIPCYKSVVWLGSSRRDLKKLPSAVRREVGHALHMEEIGERSHKTKPLRGFRGVLEIVSDYNTNTYRTVFAIKLADRIYVLHAFQKKSKRGRALPKQDIDIIKSRLQEAIRLARRNSE